MELFSLFATLALNTTDFARGISSATNQGRGLANNLGTNFKATTVAMGNLLSNFIQKAGQLTLELGKSSIDAAAAVRAEQAQFKATFGEMETQASNVLSAISDDTNILSTRLQNVGTKAFSQFKGAGLDAAESMASMDRYTRLAADAAAYYDISLEDADTRLRSFLRGNTEAGDAIGLFTSETQRNTYATEKYGAAWKDLTEAQKQMLMLDVAEDIYAQSGAIGQAAREGDSWSNTVSNLQEAWRQTLAIVGGPIVDSFTPFLQTVTAKLQDPELQKKISDFSTSLSSAFTVAFQLVTGDEETAKETIAAWWNDSVYPGIQAYFKGHFGIVLPDAQATAADVQRWWDTTKQLIGGLFFGVSPKITGKSLIAETAADLLSKSNGLEVFNQGLGASISDWTTVAGDMVRDGYAHATGLDYVPHNDYIARLHEGEAVLTKLEATEWRKGGGTNVDAAAIGAAVSAAVSDAMRGFAVYMDGHKVGNLVTETVSRNIAQNAQAGRYA